MALIVSSGHPFEFDKSKGKGQCHHHYCIGHSDTPRQLMDSINLPHLSALPEPNPFYELNKISLHLENFVKWLLSMIDSNACPFPIRGIQHQTHK